MLHFAPWCWFLLANCLLAGAEPVQCQERCELCADVGMSWNWGRAPKRMLHSNLATQLPERVGIFPAGLADWSLSGPPLPMVLIIPLPYLLCFCTYGSIMITIAQISTTTHQSAGCYQEYQGPHNKTCVLHLAKLTARWDLPGFLAFFGSIIQPLGNPQNSCADPYVSFLRCVSWVSTNHVIHWCLWHLITHWSD